ncbi:MAG: protein-L-isoaspartate(D-aspartate) O-methyltransferase [Leptothrix sp. (in: b-proteobacteria)]
MALGPSSAPVTQRDPTVSQGLDSAAVRERMVERLRLDGCGDAAVLQAFAQVPRHCFVDTALSAQAYEDTSLPIGHGQTISKPTVIARMLALLRERAGGPALGRVLEIGTGCGYQAALLGLIARHVYSVERLKALHDKARDNLAPIRSDNLRLIWGDGHFGHPPNAPYDAIISAAGADRVPAAWLDQLAPGGRLVAPVHDPARSHQVLLVVDRRADGSLVEHRLEGVRFVPLESGTRLTGCA